MFSLMGKCISKSKSASSKRKVVIGVFGLDNAGKTVTSKALQGESLDGVAPTIGFQSNEFTLNKCEVTLYDLGGGKNIRDIWKNYYADCYGSIFVIDSSDSERIEEVHATLRDTLADRRITGKPVLILANKQDKVNALDEAELTEKLNLEQVVNENKCPCRVETCVAIKGTGKKLDKTIKTGVFWLLDNIKDNFATYDERVQEDLDVQKEENRKETAERKERLRKRREQREREEEEERLRNGEPEKIEDSDDDIVVGSDPFKRVDVEALKKKEEELKALKKKKKGKKKKTPRSDNEDSTNSQAHRSQIDSDDEIMTGHRLSKKGRSRSDDEELIVPRRSRQSRKNSDPEAIYTKSAHHDGNSSNESQEEVAISTSKYRKKRLSNGDTTVRNTDQSDEDIYTQKPLRSKPSPRVPKSLMDNGLNNDLDTQGPPVPMPRHLAPLAPIGLDPIEEPPNSGRKQKKKKRRLLGKHNKTAPIGGDEEDPQDSQSAPGLQSRSVLPPPSGWGTPPLGQRNMYQRPSSRSPRLPSLEEPNEDDNRFSKYGLMDELPELNSSSRRFRPNSDYDDDIMT
ncbi:unnamed protein product [Owenia fusiformis]|uniref:Uncharacterized protein n=1 Tax=Owenia fusiformis TaxID=6347 RepID=A0A8J1TDS4_OWEFU|nr:unnamed protein product [Owenia fusiformis]